MKTTAYFAVGVLVHAMAALHATVNADAGDPAAAAERTTPAQTAQPQGLIPVPDYAGDFWSRRYLTGDWGGTRQEWANHGIQIDVNFNQTMQTITQGGRDTGTRYGGSLDYVLTLDLMRMNVMPGALFKFRAETRYGEAANDIAGPLLPVNTDGFFPLTKTIDEDEAVTITELIYTQFLSEHFGVVFGKLQTLDGDPNEFASGRGTSQFLNGNLVYSPTIALTVPYSTLGVGIILLPCKNVIISSIVLNTDDSSTNTGFDDFGDGTTWSTEMQVQYRLGTLPGGMNVGFVYGFDNDFAEIGGGRLVFNPGDGISIDVSNRDDTWTAYWSLWQYLCVEDPTDLPINVGNGMPDHQGVGLFARLAFADDDTNPIELYASIGVGGRGVIPGRDNDTFGIGYFYIAIEDTRLGGVLGVDDHSQGFEAFYNVAITPACRLTFDVQVVDTPLPDIDTAVIVGLRLNLAF